MRLFHVSDEPGIERFEPRATASGQKRVWAIEERTLCNYLLPRDCPRVCFRASPGSEAGLELLDGANAVVAIEEAWLERVQGEVLHRYEMPTETFVPEDRVAGYWTSTESIAPLAVEIESNLPARIAETGARLVVLPSLWALHDQVKDSGLEFSMIRMRNAAGRG